MANPDKDTSDEIESFRAAADKMLNRVLAFSILMILLGIAAIAFPAAATLATTL